MWGFLPLYWKLMKTVHPLEIVCHRVVWSLLFTFALLRPGFSRPHPLDLSGAPPPPRPPHLRMLISASLIGTNWIAFIWAVNSGYVLQCSLGYFLSPLANVVLGVVLLREKLSWRRRLAVILAFLGVLIKTVHYGSVPWVAIFLAFTFSLYAWCRKTAAVGSLEGFYWETVWMTPLALFGLFMMRDALEIVEGSWTTRLLLVSTGVVTALPLLSYARAARELPLSTLGLLQYISPTIQFLLAVFTFQEPFATADLVTFLLIWAGLGLFVASP